MSLILFVSFSLPYSNIPNIHIKSKNTRAINKKPHECGGFYRMEKSLFKFALVLFYFGLF